MRKISIFIICLVIFSACSSVPKFKGNGDLCGIIVDEMNQPIKEFAVYCEGRLGEKKAVYTNDSGIFVFHDLPGGKYILSGYKNNYVQLQNNEYVFSDRGKIFCAQIVGIDAALDKVIQLIKLGEIEECKDLINSICVAKDSNEEFVLNKYKEFLEKNEIEKGEVLTNENDI